MTPPSLPPGDWEEIGLSSPDLNGKEAARERGLSFRRGCHKDGDLKTNRQQQCLVSESHGNGPRWSGPARGLPEAPEMHAALRHAPGPFVVEAAAVRDSVGCEHSTPKGTCVFSQVRPGSSSPMFPAHMCSPSPKHTQQCTPTVTQNTAVVLVRSHEQKHKCMRTHLC